MARFYQPTDMPMMKITMKHNWRRWAPFFYLSSMLLLPTLAVNAQTPAPQAAPIHAENHPPLLRSFEASYQIFRSGKQHGNANRYLKLQDGHYELGYQSKVSWLLFEDERFEKSRFQLVDGRIQPFFYQMQRSGTGPNRHYELNLDWSAKQLKVDKAQKLKQVQWNQQWLDLLSFHSQIVLDLKAGKTDFVYDVLNRHGETRNYKYKVTTEEWLSLPYGKIKALRIERYGQSPDKQVYAWVAPELDYLLVRLWQSEDNVEQFDVQLKSYQPAP
jgi:hypothetical protein